MTATSTTMATSIYDEELENHGKALRRRPVANAR